MHRNNLYWIESLSLPCVWYGTRDGENDDAVKVLPITCDNLDLATRYPRSDLKHLEKSHMKRISCRRTADFTRAIMDFAEWDDGERLSYNWPQFIINLIKDSNDLSNWVNHVENFNNAKRIKFHDRKKVFLFFLCAELLGLTDEVRSVGPDEPGCSEEVQSLFDSILTIADPHKKPFVRRQSRTGIDFQADINNNILNPSYNQEDKENLTDESSYLIYTKNILTDREIKEYLNNSKYIRSLSAIQIKKCPYYNFPPLPSPLSPNDGSNIFSNNFSNMPSSVVQPTSQTIPGRTLVRYTPCVITRIVMKPEVRNVTAVLSPISDHSLIKSSIYSQVNHDRPLAQAGTPTVVYEGRNAIDSGAVSTLTIGPDDSYVEVSDGDYRWCIPLASCKYDVLPDDVALEVLAQCNYDVSTQFSVVGIE